MKIVRQFSIITLLALIGEGLHYLIPLPVPGSIYGMLLLLIALCLKIIKPEQIRETASFLIEIMPMMFIPAAVGLLESGNTADLVPMLIIIVISTVLVFGAAGLVTQAVIRAEKKGEEEQA